MRMLQTLVALILLSISSLALAEEIAPVTTLDLTKVRVGTRYEWSDHGGATVERWEVLSKDTDSVRYFRTRLDAKGAPTGRGVEVLWRPPTLEQRGNLVQRRITRLGLTYVDFGSRRFAWANGRVTFPGQIDRSDPWTHGSAYLRLVRVDVPPDLSKVRVGQRYHWKDAGGIGWHNDVVAKTPWSVHYRRVWHGTSVTPRSVGPVQVYDHAPQGPSRRAPLPFPGRRYVNDRNVCHGYSYWLVRVEEPPKKGTVKP